MKKIIQLFLFTLFLACSFSCNQKVRVERPPTPVDTNKCPPGYYGNDCQLIDCSIVDCPVNAICNKDGSGTCSCEDGYDAEIDNQGDYICNTPSRNKFAGNYVGSDACSVSEDSDTYLCVIRANSEDIKEFYMDNFGGYSVSIKALVSDEVYFTIPPQDAGKLRFEGLSLGTYNPSARSIQVSYRVGIIGEGIGEECQMLLRVK